MISVAGLVATLALAGAPAASSDRPTFQCQLDDGSEMWLFGADGGHAVADVVTEKLGADYLTKKHIGGIKFEEVSMSMGVGMSKGMYQWIKDSFDGKHSRKNGAIVACDFNYKERARTTFQEALLTEIGFPAMDANSKDAAKMTLKFRPEKARRAFAAGGRVSAATPPPLFVSTQADFSFEMPDFPGLTPDAIDALTYDLAALRNYEQEATSVEIPNLVITLSQTQAKPLYEWYESFVIRGNNGDDNEKKGRLTYHSSVGSATLLFRGMGIMSLFEVDDIGPDGLRKVKCEMYCEDVRFTFNDIL